MATGNFHSVNAENIYVIDYKDDFYWDDFQEDIGENIKESYSDFYKDTSLKSEEELRSFPSSSIGYFEEGLNFLGLDFNIRANVFLRSGYYEGGNLDYEFHNTINDSPFDDIYEIIEDINYYPEEYGINKGLFTMHKERLEEKLEKLKTEINEKVEDSLKKVSDPYKVTARFSNGETFYEKCS